MTTMELNATLLKELSSIASDESMVKDVISYIRRLRRNKKSDKTKEETISKEEILAGIDAGLKEVRLTMDGKLMPKSAREFLNEL